MYNSIVLPILMIPWNNNSRTSVLRSIMKKAFGLNGSFTLSGTETDTLSKKREQTPMEICVDLVSEQYEPFSVSVSVSVNTPQEGGDGSGRTNYSTKLCGPEMRWPYKDLFTRSVCITIDSMQNLTLTLSVNSPLWSDRKTGVPLCTVSYVR